MTGSRTKQQRALVALVEVLGLSVWFSATAVVPDDGTVVLDGTAVCYTMNITAL